MLIPSIPVNVTQAANKAKEVNALDYVLAYGKNKDDFKDDRELSKHLGLNFQRGKSKPNIDIPAGKADKEKLKDEVLQHKKF